MLAAYQQSFGYRVVLYYCRILCVIKLISVGLVGVTLRIRHDPFWIFGQNDKFCVHY